MKKCLDFDNWSSKEKATEAENSCTVAYKLLKSLQKDDRGAPNRSCKWHVKSPYKDLLHDITDQFRDKKSSSISDTICQDYNIEASDELKNELNIRIKRSFESFDAADFKEICTLLGSLHENEVQKCVTTERTISRLIDVIYYKSDINRYYPLLDHLR